MPSRTALIAGGGIGGLAAALALTRGGWSVRVFDRSARLEQHGFGLSLAPNAMAALTELGVAEEIRAHGHQLGLVEIRRGDDRVLRCVDAGRFWRRDRPAGIIALRSTLHRTLLAALRKADIELHAEVVGYRVVDEGVIVRIADGREARGDVLIGADGVGSRVRAILHPSDPPAEPGGYWALRGMARDTDGLLGRLSGVSYLGSEIEAAALRAGEGAVYWYASLLARNVPAGTPDGMSLLASSPVFAAPTLHAIIEATRRDDMRIDELFVRDPLAAWGRGPVTLLGDAAHPVLPHTGQGAALALEDGVALGLALGAATQTSDIVPCLRRYEAVRQPLTARVMRAGPRAARVTTTASAWVRWARDAGIRFAPIGAAALAVRIAPRRDPHRALR